MSNMAVAAANMFVSVLCNVCILDSSRGEDWFNLEFIGDNLSGFSNQTQYLISNFCRYKYICTRSIQSLSPLLRFPFWQHPLQNILVSGAALILWYHVQRPSWYPLQNIPALLDPLLKDYQKCKNVLKDSNEINLWCHLMDYINPGNCVVHNKVTAILHGFAALISLAIAAANWRCGYPVCR